MKKKQPVTFAHKFPNADPLALKLLERLLAFDPKDRPTAEEVIVESRYVLFFLKYFIFCYCVMPIYERAKKSVSLVYCPLCL